MQQEFQPKDEDLELIEQTISSLEDSEFEQTSRLSGLNNFTPNSHKSSQVLFFSNEKKESKSPQHLAKAISQIYLKKPTEPAKKPDPLFLIPGTSLPKSSKIPSLQSSNHEKDENHTKANPNTSRTSITNNTETEETQASSRSNPERPTLGQIPPLSNTHIPSPTNINTLPSSFKLPISPTSPDMSIQMSMQMSMPVDTTENTNTQNSNFNHKSENEATYSSASISMSNMSNEDLELSPNTLEFAHSRTMPSLNNNNGKGNDGDVIRKDGGGVNMQRERERFKGKTNVMDATEEFIQALKDTSNKAKEDYNRVHKKLKIKILQSKREKDKYNNLFQTQKTQSKPAFAFFIWSFGFNLFY